MMKRIRMEILMRNIEKVILQKILSGGSEIKIPSIMDVSLGDFEMEL